MKKWKLTQYISGRVLLLGAVSLALAALGAVLLLVAAAAHGSPAWPGLILLAACAALGAAWWGWAIVPYQNEERMVSRYLTGYLPSEEDLDCAALTPSMRAQLEMLEKIIRSPQLMDLNRRQAQYLALQNQINPHFLYNTLESIRGEALIAGLDGVADMTEALARFFRYTITKVENLVSVEEELENCETYFQIQRYRFGDRLKLHIEYETEAWEEVLNCRIPKLTLQPILENSIIHGTELKIGEGNLRIRFRRTEQRLLICISDDGVGMDEETLAALNASLSRGAETFSGREEQQGGIALSNVNNRIHLLFGDEYGLHVYSIPQRGTDVEISIPVVTKA